MQRLIIRRVELNSLSLPPVRNGNLERDAPAGYQIICFKHADVLPMYGIAYRDRSVERISDGETFEGILPSVVNCRTRSGHWLSQRSTKAPSLTTLE